MDWLTKGVPILGKISTEFAEIQNYIWIKMTSCSMIWIQLIGFMVALLFWFFVSLYLINTSIYSHHQLWTKKCSHPTIESETGSLKLIIISYIHLFAGAVGGRVRNFFGDSKILSNWASHTSPSSPSCSFFGALSFEDSSAKSLFFGGFLFSKFGGKNFGDTIGILSIHLLTATI